MKLDLVPYQAPGASTPLLDNTLFARIINSLCIPMCVIDAVDLTLLTANAAARADAAFWHCANRCSCSFAGSSTETGIDCAVRRALATRAHAVREHTGTDANGVARTYEMHAHPIFSSEGTLIFIVEYMLDVTDRSRAEQSRRESDERFRQVAENAIEWIWEVDADGVYRYCNPMVQQVLGYAPEELVGQKHFYDFFAPSMREELKNAALAAFARKEPFRNFINPNVHKNGSMIVMETSGAPMLDDAGNLLGYRGTDLDITARIEYERQLKQYFDIVLSMQVGLYVYRLDDPNNDESLRLVALNPASLATIGLAEEKAIGRRIDEVFPNFGKLGIYRQFADVVRTGVPFENKEFHYGDSNASSPWFAFKAFPLPDDCVGVLFEDITGRKRMEEALQGAKNYAENLIQTANAIVVVLDANGSIQTFNDAAERITGYSLEELKGRSWFETLCPKDRYPDVWEIFSRLPAGTLPKNAENPILAKSGEERYVVWQNNEIKEQGRIAGTISFGIDITERKHAEEAERRDKAFLDQLIETAREGIIVCDNDGHVLRANDEFQRMFGYSRNEIVGRPVDDLVAPDEFRDQACGITGQVAGGTRMDFEAQRRRKDGSLIDVSVIASPIVIDGKQEAFYAIYQDITDRKRAEKAERREKAFLDQLIETAREGIVVCDNEGHVLRINDEFQRLFGFSRPQALGKLIDDLVAPDDSRNQACGITGEVAGGKRMDFEVQRRREDGSLIDVSVIASPIVIDGRQVAVYAIYRDITDRKRAEKAERREKAFLDQLIETASEGIVVASHDGRVLRINDEFQRMFGYSQQEAVGSSIDDLVASGPTHAIASEATTNVAKNGRLNFDAQRQRKDGSMIDVSVIASPIIIDGEQVAAYAIYRDITDRKRAETALRISEEKYRSITENTKDIIIQVDTEGLFTYISQQVSQLGYTPEDLISRNMLEFIHPDDRAGMASRFQERMTTGHEVLSIFRVVSKNGEATWIEENGHVQRDDSGKPVGYTGILRDISESHGTEEKLRQARDEAEQANKAKSQFVANVSHEIRTPMNAIIGFADMLLEDNLTDEQREHAEIVKMSAETLLSLINDILDFSKIEAGRLDLENVPFEPERIAHEVCQLVSSNIAAKRIELLCDIGDRVPSEVRGDPFRFRQVLANLLSNASKFTETGEIELAMDVEEFEEDRIKLHVTVRDTGISIPEDQLSLIFAPFRQADGSTTRKHGGTGLGLTICKQIANLLGGDVWAESTEGAGSTFHFTAWLGKSVEASGLRPDAEQLPVKKLLVVDDNERALDIITRRFASLGQRVVSRNSRTGAIEAMRDARETGSPFDICILDATMVTGEGCETIAEIQKLCGDSPCVVVGMALLINREARKRVHGHFDVHLHKPVRRADCIELLRAGSGGPRSADLLEAYDKTPGGAPDSPAGAPGEGEAGVDRTIRILLAEDNPVNQKLAKLILEKAGYAVEVASNGKEAVERFAASPDRFDLIFMDIQMPLMDGLEATKAIRAKGFSAIPIVAMTARAMSEDHDSCLQAGMTGYITKPIRKTVVLEMVEKLTLSAANPTPAL